MSHVEAVTFLKSVDPALARLVEVVGPCGLHALERSESLLEALSSSIISQQLSTKVAKVIYARFLALYGDGRFPEAIEIIETPDEKLRGVGLSGQKARYLKDLAQRVHDGSLPTLEALHALDDEAIIRALTQVKGIGRWTVQMLLIFDMGRPDVWPVDDLGIRTGFKRLYGLEELPKAKALEPLGDRWRPWRSIASWYLWRILELKDFEAA